MKSRSGELNFNDVLSDLAVLYREGVLVPFIGSGMSLPTCTTWLQFVKSLATNVGLGIPHDAFKKNRKADAQTLYRLADQAVAAIRPMEHADRVHIYRCVKSLVRRSEADHSSTNTVTRLVVLAAAPHHQL